MLPQNFTPEMKSAIDYVIEKSNGEKQVTLKKSELPVGTYKNIQDAQFLCFHRGHKNIDVNFKGNRFDDNLKIISQYDIMGVIFDFID